VPGLFLGAAVFTLGEMAETPAVNDLVVGLAPSSLRGRYQAVSQLAWSVAGVLAPGVFAWLLDRGPALPWALLVVVCVAAVAGTGALRRVLPVDARHGNAS